MTTVKTKATTFRQKQKNCRTFFFTYMQRVIDRLLCLGKHKLASNYRCALSSFRRFRGDTDLLFSELNDDMMVDYEAWLRHSGICKNTSSCYIRNLRAIYNRAVKEGIVTQCHPFRDVYTGIDKTIKRAISLPDLKRIKELDLSSSPCQERARDFFLFSFYTRGMSFVDMAYAQKSDLSHGILTYRRRKTDQLLSVKWENKIQQIVSKYETKDSSYLLPIIRHPNNAYREYRNASRQINIHLRKIGEQLHLPIPLTMYVARHTWASVARHKNISTSVISEAMGHNSEETTRIYLSSLDTAHVDKANKLVMNSI